jgi:hypothetical protein
MRLLKHLALAALITLPVLMLGTADLSTEAAYGTP